MKKLTDSLTGWIKRRTFSDWAFATVVGIALFLRGPLLIDQFKHEGKILIPSMVDGKQIPPANEKSILVFWATWCGPCTIELGRLNSAIQKGEISAQHLYAVNMGEELAVVERTVKEKKYLFQVIRDERGEIASKLGVTATPTIAFVNKDNTVKWLSSGLSPTLIYRIQFFQKN